RVLINENLALYTYFKIGGPADYFVTVKSSQELKEIILLAEASKTPWFILGGGSNILVGDLGYRGLVIKNEADKIATGRTGRYIPRNDGYAMLTAESGVKMVKLAAFANENGLAGLEVFMSVPGTLGGAVFNNSHFRPEKNEFIGNLVESAEILEGRRKKEKGRRESKIVDKKWFRFGYDYSRLHDEPGVVLKVKFRLKKADAEKLKAKSLELLKERNIRQPVGQSSCGCMFKNPDGLSAGQLIDDAEMKGKRVGGAMISDKHANFVINTGGAKATEVLKLMELIKEAVKTKSGIDLEPEIFMVGEF
ncbi:MAG: UDP-N-acetylmuramate dehydrogenase, partial [Patescibacteria group bacterium]|nr:UDP-N-acetylmuramate dehydrogenase [Patescibacteria group bacterium]